MFELVILILIIMILGIMNFRSEHYQNLNIYPSRLLGMQKFSKLKNGKIIGLDIKPIQPMIGETKCTIVRCIPWFDDNMTCYECS